MIALFQILRRSALPVFILALACSGPVEGARTKKENEESEARLKKDIFFLASPQCEGRGPTTNGLNLAADYIAAEFKKIGLKPGYKGAYFYPFKIAGAEGKVTLTGPGGKTIDLKPREHFNPLGLDQTGTAEADLVFAGYGVNCANPAYDDYDNIDVKGKIVALIRDTPRASDPKRSRDMAANAALATKVTLAQKKGAAGVLLVNDAETAQDGDAPLDYSYTRLGRRGGPAGKSIPALAIRRSVLEQMLPAGKTLADIEKQIDRDLKPASMTLNGWKAKIAVTGGPEVLPLKNVIGVLEGNGPLADETIVVGAHYDHLGYGSQGSLAPQSKKRAIHHGADDNGSGTTALLELARRMAAIPNRQGRRIVFMTFSGEELGLLGSAAYCKNPVFPLDKTAAMLNLDMVGRLVRDPKTGTAKVLTEGHGTAKPFKELIDGMAKKYNLTLKSQASGFGPSDHASFAGKKVPVLFFWTGTHPDYHRPSDTADKINIEGMRQLTDMSEEVLNTFTTMPKPEFIEVKGSKAVRPTTGPRLGIRPGYTEGVVGVEVEGVTAGGAAEKGGVKGGDRIVKIADKDVKDITTYMQAMSTQKIGTTVNVVVIRKGKEMKLAIKLE